MIAASAAVALTWLTLLGIAYFVRYKFSARLEIAAAAVGACYLALAVCSLLLLGLNQEGMLGAAGMLVPAVAAGALIAFPRERRQP